ncbi:MAG: helix-turn-helix transcriptional regulator [Bdellovibrio sp.]|nr:helix-turn-helix transcriptional regulator [Bdellovibrio sp.]
MKKGYIKAKTHIKLLPGDSVRIARELQVITQQKLSELCDMPQSTISAIEKNKINLGVERAKVLARALKVHPSVLLFSGWDIEVDERKAA